MQTLTILVAPSLLYSSLKLITPNKYEKVKPILAFQRLKLQKSETLRGKTKGRLGWNIGKWGVTIGIDFYESGFPDIEVTQIYKKLGIKSILDRLKLMIDSHELWSTICKSFPEWINIVAYLEILQS